MVEFTCGNCGEKESRNVLPGKHTILGEIATLNRSKTCCGRPDYRDGRGVKSGMVDRDLRDLVTAIRA